MSSRTVAKTRATESSAVIHHFVPGGFAAENVQTIDKVYHTVTVDTVVFGNRTYIRSQRTGDITLLF